MKTFSPATRQKIKEAKTLIKQRHSSQTIQVDEHWKIIRADELNWQILYKGKPFGFYGSILSALLALESKKLDQEAKDSLQTIHDYQKTIHADLVRVILTKRDLLNV